MSEFIPFVDHQAYVRLCNLFGSSTDLVQGSGGNFSVKTTTHIQIKSSGTLLADTTTTSGFVICSLAKLHELLENDSIQTRDAVVGGDAQKAPSMEDFFHLIPKKWVIHIHPTFLLGKLCTPSASWSR